MILTAYFLHVSFSNTSFTSPHAPLVAKKDVEREGRDEKRGAEIGVKERERHVLKVQTYLPSSLETV
jgi:hypothetical protein